MCWSLPVFITLPLFSALPPGVLQVTLLRFSLTPLLGQAGRLPDPVPASPSTSQFPMQTWKAGHLKGTVHRPQGEPQPSTCHCMTLSESLRLWDINELGQLDLLLRILLYMGETTSYNLYSHVWMRDKKMTRILKMLCRPLLLPALG